MKKQLFACSLLLLLSLSAGLLNAQSQPPKLLRHIVMITFKEGAPAAEIKEVDDSFGNLATTLKMVKGYETGTALSDGQSKAITHVYSFSFESEKDLASYGASAEHQRHIKVGQSITERVQGIDYWAGK